MVEAGGIDPGILADRALGATEGRLDRRPLPNGNGVCLMDGRSEARELLLSLAARDVLGGRRVRRQAEVDGGLSHSSGKGRGELEGTGVDFGAMKHCPSVSLTEGLSAV